MDLDAYKKQWILHLERATHYALDEVNVRNLFIKSRVSTSV
jgi:hypothetical protein